MHDRGGCTVNRGWQASLMLIALPLQVPFLFKYAVDALTADPSGAVAAATPLGYVLPATILVGYGAARTSAALCNEVRNALFAKVGLCPLLSPCG